MPTIVVQRPSDAIVSRVKHTPVQVRVSGAKVIQNIRVSERRGTLSRVVHEIVVGGYLPSMWMNSAGKIQFDAEASSNSAQWEPLPG